MKKILSVLLISFMVFAVMPTTYSYAGGMAYQENVLDKMYDWATTLGKDEAEKDRILAANMAERHRKHSAKLAKKAAEKAESDANAMKKKMGL